MKTYCVRQKKKTDCVSGSERTTIASNGRPMLVCICAECGATKTQFISGQSGGALKRDFACGYNLQGKRAGTKEECFRTGRIGYWGLNQLDDGEIDGLLHDRQFERNRKARERRRAKTGERRQANKNALVLWRPPKKPATKKPAVRKPAKKPEGSVKMVGDNIYLTHPDGVTDIISKKRYEILLANAAKPRPMPVVKKAAPKKKIKEIEPTSFVTPEMVAKNIRDLEEAEENYRERVEELMRTKDLVPPSEKAKARSEMFKDYGIADDRLRNMGGDDIRIRRIVPRIRRPSI